eukprot:c17384_g1_i1.p1 GENE.c17384_g1_i1~~c17384_g1_i1.p1  ORF type:complete len:155 (+),score=23.11 c17384_g1_i1:671-1135(+)
MNPFAEIIATTRCSLPIGKVLNRHAFEIASPTLPKHLLTPHSESFHPTNVSSVGFERDPDQVGLVTVRSMSVWLNAILYERQVPGGGEVFRVKALVATRDSNKVIFQGVHTIFDYSEFDWDEGEAPVHRIVIIGRDLSKDHLFESFTKLCQSEA